MYRACSWSSHLGHFGEINRHSRHLSATSKDAYSSPRRTGCFFTGLVGSSLYTLFLPYLLPFLSSRMAQELDARHATTSPSKSATMSESSRVLPKPKPQGVYEFCRDNYCVQSACFSKCCKSDDTGTLQQLCKVCDTLFHYQEA